MTTWALIPLKAPSLAKQRLAGCLAPRERRLLVARMAARVIAALRGAHLIDAIAVTSPEPVGPGLVWIPDHAGDLNAALGAARDQLVAQGARELLVLHADLPWLTAAEVDAFVSAGRASGLALAPDRHGRGTNALFSAPPARIEFSFGAGSLARHQAAARALGIAPAQHQARGLAWDVDEATDLQHLPAALIERDPDTPPTPRISPWPRPFTPSLSLRR